MKVKDTIAEEFNAFSKNYTEDMVHCVPYYLELLSEFNKHMPENFQPKRILDLGCGNGNVTNTLIQLFPEADYTLVDASQEMLELCNHRFKASNINCHHSYFIDFNFKTNYYDLICASFSLHHCSAEDKKNVYNSIYASLKIGGVFACSDLMISRDDNAHSKHLRDWEDFVLKSFPDGEKWAWLLEHYNQFDTPENIEYHIQYLKNAGFKQYNFTLKEDHWAHFKAQKN